MKGSGVSSAKGNEVCRPTGERGWGTQHQPESEGLQRQTAEGKTPMTLQSLVRVFILCGYTAIGLVAIEFRSWVVRRRATEKLLETPAAMISSLDPRCPRARIAHGRQHAQLEVVDNSLRVVPDQNHAHRLDGDVLAPQDDDVVVQNQDQDQGHLGQGGERVAVGLDPGVPRGEGEVITERVDCVVWHERVVYQLQTDSTCIFWCVV